VSTASAVLRRSQQRRDARRAILAATEAILVEEGADGLSIRRLAQRCGYTAPTIYHHFGDKHGLVAVLLEERFRQLWIQVRGVEPSLDPAVTLRSLAIAFVRFGLRHPNHYQLLVSADFTDEDEPPSAGRSRALLEVPLAELESRGRLRAPDVLTALQMIWAAAHGVISLKLHRPHHEFVDDLPERVVDALIEGLVVREEIRCGAGASPAGEDR